MINKRGRMIALIGGLGFLVIIVVDNMSQSTESKDSFYETFNATGEKVTLGKNSNKRKTASLKSEEDKLLNASESYKKNARKDEAFSLYQEVLVTEPVVEETVVERDEEPQSEPAPEKTVKRNTKPKVVYVDRPNQQEEVQEKPKPKTRTFQRVRGRETAAKSTTATATGGASEKYYKAEIFTAITVDMAFPSAVKIRLMEDITLPNGKVIEQYKLMQSVPTSDGKTMDLQIPEYGLVVYNAPHIKGIPLTAAEGIIKEVNDMPNNNQARTTAFVPLVGSVELNSGKKNVSQKVSLQQNRIIYLKWENE